MKPRNMTLIVFSFAAFLAALAVTHAGAVQVKREHPRIFVNKSELSELAKRCAPDGIAAKEYAAIKLKVDGFVDGRRAMNGQWLPSLCIVYQVEKTLGRDASKYVKYLRKGLWGTDGKGGGSVLSARRQWYPAGKSSVLNGYMGGNGCWFGWDALCYDWFYDALTPEERKKYGDLLGRWLHSFMGLKPNHPARITMKWGSCLYNQTWGPCDGYAWGNYYCRDGVGNKTMVALAIYGEGTRYQRSAEEWIASWAQMVPAKFIPVIKRQGGVWTAGPGHGGATAQSVTLSFEAWRTATGQDLFKSFHTKGLKRLAYWPLFAAMPHSRSWGHIDDTGAGMLSGVARMASRIAPLMAKTYRHPAAQWMAHNYMETPETRSWPFVLWYDPLVPAAKTEELPLAFHFEGVGHVYARSAWNDSNATWAFFDCGPHFAGYQSDDDGSFQIYKGGGLAMRGGTDRTTGRRSYSNSTVLIYDPSEKPSDGGVLLGKGYVDEGIQRGTMAAFGDDPAFTYACANLTGAYNRKKVQQYTRHFLYLRFQPECFVIYDHVVATRPDYPKMWLLHVMNQPRMMKGATNAAQSASGAGLQVYVEADGAIVSTYTPDNNPIKNGRGRFRSSSLGAMRVVKLLPTDSRMTARGGDGFDNWGCPYDPRTNKNFPMKSSEGAGLIDRSWWRIEVEPSRRSAATEFLHVLIPRLMPKGAYKTPAQLAPGEFAAAELVEQSAEEVEIKITSASGEWRVTLNRTGVPGGRIERGNRNWELPVNLQPNHELLTK